MKNDTNRSISDSQATLLSQDHKEPDNIEQVIAKPESNEFMSEKEVGEMNPKEKIAVWMAQQEHKNPGFISDHLNKHGMIKFSTGHYVMNSSGTHKGLPRIWSPGEYEAEKNKSVMPGLKRSFAKIIKEAFLKKADEPFVTLSTGQEIHFSLPIEGNFDGSASEWQKKHEKLSGSEHNEAAGLHLEAAMHEHNAGNESSRDKHLTDAVEHMAVAGDSNTHYKVYTDLLDKFYE